MEHRREPMGGEVDSDDQVIGSDWTNNNNIADPSNQSPDSVSNEHFVDHLTLKVRSLLSNWDECEPQTNTHLTSQGNQPTGDSRQHFDFGATLHANTFVHASNKGNNGGAQVMVAISKHNPITIPGQSSKDSILGFQRNTPLMQGSSHHQSNRSTRPEDFLMIKNSASQGQNDNISQPPRILVNENAQANLSFEASQAVAHNTAKVDTCLSYDDFSTALQNLKDRMRRNRQQEHENPSGQNKISQQKSYIFAEGMEQSRPQDSAANPNQNYFPRPPTSLHLDVRHESLENEAERSWSEITVKAESFLQPCNASTRGNQEGLPEQDLTLSQVTHLRNSSLVTKDGTTRPAGINFRASNRVSPNMMDPTIGYNCSLTDTPRIVVGSNVSNDNVPLNPAASNTNRDRLDSRFKSGVASKNESPVEFNSKPKNSIGRHSRKNAFNPTGNNEPLGTVNFNANQDNMASDSRFNAGVPSGNASPVEFNSKPKSSSDRQFRMDPRESVSNNAPLNLIDFNTAYTSSITGGSRVSSYSTATINTYLNPVDGHTGQRDNLIIALRSNLVNNEFPVDFNPAPRDGTSRSASGVGCSASSRASMDDWRINLFDPSRNPMRDPEPLNYSPSDLANYSPAAFDPMERETPPLSASSMASSRRLEWDNGADIGYSIAILNPRTIPEMARSDPEGISLMNESLNVGPSPIPFPYFSFRSGGSSSVNFPAAESRDASSQASSVAGYQDEDILERSSSQESLSRSGSKKSVIYNSVRDMRRQSKSLSSKNCSPRSQQPFRNMSCPNLTDLGNSLDRHNWEKDNLSKSEEQVGAGKVIKTFLFPGLMTHRTRNVQQSKACKVGQQSSSEMNVYDRGDVLMAIPSSSKESLSHACTTCQAAFSSAGDQMPTSLSYSKSQNAEEEEVFQFLSEEIEYDDDNISRVDTMVEWVDDRSNLPPDLQYVEELSEDYPRPILVVSNNVSKLKGGNLSKIVGSFFENNTSVSDHSASGHSEVKPHIRWYPFTPTATTQDIKDVSTQTAMSFVAQQLKDAPTQAAFQQQTSSPEDATVELHQESIDFSGIADIPGKVTREDIENRDPSGVSDPEAGTKSAHQNNAAIPLTDLFFRTLNLESGFLSPENSFQEVVDDRVSDPQELNAFQTCRSCHTDLNIGLDSSSGRDEHYQTLIVGRHLLNTEYLSSTDNNSTIPLEQLTGSRSGRLPEVSSASSPGALLMNPRGERKLGVGECRIAPNALQRDSTSSIADLDGSQLRTDSVTASLPHSALFPFAISDPRRNVTPRDNAPAEKPSNVRDLVNALNHYNTSIPQNSQNRVDNSNDFPQNIVTTAINTLNTFQDSRSRTEIPGGNAKPIQPAPHNKTSALANFQNNLSSKLSSVSQNGGPSTNLLDFLSQNRPFSDSKYVEQREGIPKSFSDPLIAVHDQDASSEEGGDLVTFRSHVYEDPIGDSQMTSQYDERLQPDVIYQENLNNTPSAEPLDFSHAQNKNLDRNVSSVLQTRHEQEVSVNSERRFVSGSRCQVSQSTSAIVDSANSSKKESNRTNKMHAQEGPATSEHRFVGGSRCQVSQSTSVIVDSVNSSRNANNTTNRMHEQEGPGNSERRFASGDHFQVSQSTCMADDSANFGRKGNKSLSERLVSSPLFTQRDFLHSDVGSEDVRFRNIAQSSSSRGDGFFNSLGKQGDNCGIGQSTSQSFSQTLENARRIGSGDNAGNLSWTLQSDAQTQSRNNKADFSSQMLDGSERHFQRPLHLGSQSYPSISVKRDTTNYNIKATIGNNTHKYASTNTSRLGEFSDGASQEMQQTRDTVRNIQSAGINRSTKKNSDARVPTENEIDYSYLQFLEDSHRQSQTRPRTGSKSLMKDDGNVLTYNHTLDFSATRPGDIYDSRRQQSMDTATRISDSYTNGIKPSENLDHIQSGISDHSTSSRQFQEEFSREYQQFPRHKPQPNEGATRAVDSSTNAVKPLFRNHTIQSGISHQSTNFHQFQDEFTIQNPQLMEATTRTADISTTGIKLSENQNYIRSGISNQSTSSGQFQDEFSGRNRPISGSSSYPSLTRWDSNYGKRDPLVANRNFSSVGVQVSGSSLEFGKCSFCHQSRSSHLNHCPQKDRFKVVLGQALEKGLPKRRAMCERSGTSFCVFSKTCFCCCNKTLQEAFNFHRAEIVERIEARQKDVETKTGRSFFLNLATHAATDHQDIKLRLKSVSAKPTMTSKPHSNKENMRKSSRNYSAPTSNNSKQKGRLNNLNKYNRVMSKIYSQRLKSEILRGKVNFSRHEILMNS